MGVQVGTMGKCLHLVSVPANITNHTTATSSTKKFTSLCDDHCVQLIIYLNLNELEMGVEKPAKLVRGYFIDTEIE